jgi:dimethylaniline monooxygenase (N-oxide forming)
VVERRVELYKRVVHPAWPGLYFVGFFNVSGGANISMMDVQAEWVAALVSGASSLPDEDEMRQDIARERERLARRFPGSPRYGLELEPRQYKRDIARDLARPARTSPAAARTVVGQRSN